MGEQMDLQRLRGLIEGVCITLYQRYRHEDLPALCERLGLPSPPPKDQGTKHERLTASLGVCPDDRLPHVAQAVLDSEPLIAPERMELQDVVWLGGDYVEVPGRTRRELAKELDLSDHIKYPDRFLTLLGSLWDLGEDEFTLWGPTLAPCAPTFSAT